VPLGPIDGRRLTTAATRLALGLALVALLLLVVGPRTGAYRVSVVLSDSMAPAWEAGDVVVSTPTAPQDLRVGDVITFTPPADGRPSVTHRIVAIDEPGAAPVVRTRGDASGADDPWGPIRLAPDTAWRVRADVPNLGWALAGLRHPAALAATTILVPALLLVLLLIRIWWPSPARPGTVS
jgi:signal peptidase